MMSLTALLSPLWLAMAARADLNTFNTAHYQIFTDLEHGLADNLAKHLEMMYSEYSYRLANFSASDPSRFKVYIYQHRDDYMHLTDGKFPNTGGIFIQNRELLAAFFEGQGRDQLQRTLQHEAFHQFARSAISRRLPPWVNEGLAQVFEEGLWVGSRFVIEQVPPRRLRQLQKDMREQKMIPFRDFLAIDDARWGQILQDAPAAAVHYSQAWAMTHFLIFAKGEDGQPKYRQRLINMLKLLHDGMAPQQAFTQAFSTNIDGFQERFLEYINNLKPTTEAVFVERQEVLADMMIALKEHGQPVNDIDAFRQVLVDESVRLRYSKGNVQWSTETDPNIYFRDANGRSMSRQQLYFSPRGGAPLPDIVCQPMDSLRLRTIFHDGAGKIDHETLLESN